MLDHLSVQCADLAASSAFYDAVLAPLGGQRIMDFGEAIGYGVPPSTTVRVCDLIMIHAGAARSCAW